MNISFKGVFVTLLIIYFLIIVPLVVLLDPPKQTYSYECENGTTYYFNSTQEVKEFVNNSLLICGKFNVDYGFLSEKSKVKFINT